jgi:hypothetical protein
VSIRVQLDLACIGWLVAAGISVAVFIAFSVLRTTFWTIKNPFARQGRGVLAVPPWFVAAVKLRPSFHAPPTLVKRWACNGALFRPRLLVHDFRLAALGSIPLLR